MSEEESVPGGRVYLRARSSVYQCAFRDEDGRTIRRSTGKRTEADAWQELIRVYRESKSISFKAAVVSFFKVKRRSLRPATLENYWHALRVVDPYFGQLSLNQIDRTRIKAFVAARRDKVSDVTIRRDLAFVSSLITHAQNEMDGEAPEVNTIISFSKRHLVVVKRDTFLTRDEYERLVEATTEPWHAMVIRFAVNAGMRHGEILHARKAWIDWHRGAYGEILLPREFTKSKRPRVIPVFPEIASTLKTWCESTPGLWIFGHGDPPKPYTTCKNFFTGARCRAERDHVRFHDLRHTFASWWVQNGGDLAVLKEMLGHATMDMVMRYDHLDSFSAHRA